MSLKSTFKRASVEVEMEFGSLSELAGYIGDQASALTKIFGEDMESVVKGLSDGTVDAEGATATTSDKPKRGRPAKNQPDPATAVAPPPAPIPAATPPAPAVAPATPSPELAAQVASANGGIPPFLDRTAAPPAPPPAPPAPPAAPVVPPSGILAGKVIGNLEQRATDDATKKALVDWLAGPSYGIVQPGSTFDDTIAAIRLMPDDKLGQVATALSVA